MSALTWRPSEPIIEADLDVLVARLSEIDAEVCLSTPTDDEAGFVISLGSMAAGYHEAATESVRLLLAVATTLGIDAYIVQADVCSEDGQARFDRADLVQGPRS